MKKPITAGLALFCCFVFLTACTGMPGHPSATPTPETTPRLNEPAPSPRSSPLPESPQPETPPTAVTEPANEEFVKVLDWIPSLYIELRYATDDNFTGETIYRFSQAYLRYGTVKKLLAAQEALAEQGYSLKIWDAFRPVSAQFKLWELVPDPVYVANPNTGYSSHSRGNTVDVTLVTAEGGALEMPSGFDEFSVLGDRDYSDVGADAAANARLLEDAMTKAGFNSYDGEWWHFSDADIYPAAETYEPAE